MMFYITDIAMAPAHHMWRLERTKDWKLAVSHLNYEVMLVTWLVAAKMNIVSS